MSKRTQAFLAIIVASLFWSTAGLTAKYLVKDVSPLVVGFYRFFFASLIMLPFFIREKIISGQWKQLVIPTVIGALNIPLYYLGIKTTTANSATLIFTAGPLATAILSYFLIKEKNSITKWIGIILGLIGVVLIIVLPTLEKGPMVNGDLQGNILIATGMISWTIYTIWSRPMREQKRFSPVTTTSIYFFLTTSLCLILLLVTKQQLFPPQLFQIDYLCVLWYAAIFITVVTFFLFQWALEYISATTASFKQYVDTFFSIILNIMFLGEKLTVGLVIGGLLISLGVAIAVIGKIRQKKRPK